MFTLDRLAQIRRWSGIAMQVAGFQIIVQGINAVTGLMLVRYMTKQDYACFTIASSLLATLSLLADGGVSTGVTAIGGRIYEHAARLSKLLHQALRLSHRLAVLGFFLVVPLFYWLYARIETPPWVAVQALILTGLAAWPSVALTLLNAANRLHTRIRVIQWGEVLGASSRLFLTCALFAGGWLVTLPVLGGTMVANWVSALYIRRKSSEFLQEPAVGVSYDLELRSFVRSLYANHLFFCIQGQVATWIIGWLAGSSEVADLGALGRLGVLFVVITAPLGYLAVPAMSRIRNVRRLRRRMSLTLILAFLVAVAIVFLAWVQPAPFLWLLGGNYGHLTAELPLALGGQGVMMMASLAWGLVLSRGWVQHAWVSIVTTLFGFAVGVTLFPLGTVAGMLKFNFIVMVPTLLLCLGIIAVRLTRTSEFHAE